MATARELETAATDGLDWIARQDGVREAEVFTAANAVSVARVAYSSHIPSNGLEEPKSVESFGIAIQAVFESAAGPLLGFGHEVGEIGPEAVARCLDRARHAAVSDPDFESLPRPGLEKRRPRLTEPTDGAGLLDDDGLVAAGWRELQAALGVWQASDTLARAAGGADRIAALGLIVSGDVTVLSERIALASTALGSLAADISTVALASITAMIERLRAKGTGWCVASTPQALTPEAGIEAAEQALAAIGGTTVPSGRYTVVFGPQAVADIVSNLLLPACHASAFYSSTTPFSGRLGRAVAAAGLTFYDDGSAPNRPGAKAITCEGLPAGRTPLLDDGRLVGCLTNWYEARRLLRDPELATKLGDPALARQALVPRSGFRFGVSGGRQPDGPPGIAGTSAVLEGRAPLARPELLARVGDGLYIGRIWYTYAVNGLAAGDFTCTAVGDSYMIRGGRLAKPIGANVVRIDDNLLRLLGAVSGVGATSRPTAVWGGDEIVYAPELAVDGVPVTAIAPQGGGRP